MKLLPSVSFIAIVGFSLMGSSFVSAQSSDYSAPNGGTFMCDTDGSTCTFDGNRAFSNNSAGGSLNFGPDGRVWIASDSATATLSLGACTSGTCPTTCMFGCTCVQPDGTDCPLDIVIETTTAPTRAPTVVTESTTVESTTVETTTAPSRAPTVVTEKDPASAASFWKASSQTVAAIAFVAALVGF
jgi:hypothetical protein